MNCAICKEYNTCTDKIIKKVMKMNEQLNNGTRIRAYYKCPKKV